MRKKFLFVLLLVVLLFAVALPALATPPDHANARTCTLTGGSWGDGGDYSVGAMMQTLMDRSYPADTFVAEAVTPIDTLEFYGNWDNLGDFISKKC